MDTKRGDDAQDRAPHPKQPDSTSPDSSPSADKPGNDGAIPVEDLNSADDEGAN